MSLHRKKIGKIGEDFACDYLLHEGHTLLARNFTTHWGEIDLIVEKDEKIVFVEVKTKIGDKKGKPYEAVNYKKLQSLKRPIQFYLSENNLLKRKCDLIVIGIILNKNEEVEELKVYDDIKIL